jgi:hypothetical protein
MFSTWRPVNRCLRRKVAARRQPPEQYPPALEVLEDRTLPDAAPDFVARRDFRAALDPTQAVVGDFNGDGIRDLAVADRNGVSFSILLGNGDGTFGPPTNYHVPYPPNSLAVGDFDRDGRLDLAVTYTGYDFGFIGNQVGIWFGNGDGTFRAGPELTVGSSPYSVKVGDFTGDGLDDLAVANAGSQSVSIVLGHGDGTFAPAQNYAVGKSPYAVTVGNFHDDGHLDVATANYADNTVSVLRGNGDGTFAPAQNIPVGLHPIDLAAGAFNGDGHLDLAVALGGAHSVLSDAGLAILLGHGDGTFGPPTVYPAGGADYGVVVGDFNGDGIPDVAVTAGGAYDDDVRLFLGNGDGTFRAGQHPSTGTGPYGIAAADLTGDGHLDLVTANHFVDTVSVLLGDGTGAFRAAPDYRTGTNTSAVVAADFDGDGRQDLAVANWGNGQVTTESTVSVLLNNGDGTFQPKQDYPVGSRLYPDPMGLAVGDFNGDGIPDLATADYGSGEVSVLLGNGDGTFQPARNIPVGGGLTAIAVADFNGDGRADIAVTSLYNHNVSILLGNGDGTFQSPQPCRVADNPKYLTVGDFNGDGVPDLAVLSFDPYPHGTVTVLLGNGDGTFREGAHFQAGGIVRSIATSDLTGDGRQDLVVGNMLTSTTGDLVIFFGNGDATFQAPRTVDLGAIPAAVVATDLNGDAVPDLAVATDSNNVAVLAGNGDGTFGAAHYFGVGSGPRSIAAADFNGDGRTDLATANFFGARDGLDDPTSLGLSILINDTPDGGRGTESSIPLRDGELTPAVDAAVTSLLEEARAAVGAGPGSWESRTPIQPPRSLATPTEPAHPLRNTRRVDGRLAVPGRGGWKPASSWRITDGPATLPGAWVNDIDTARALVDQAFLEEVFTRD